MNLTKRRTGARAPRRALSSFVALGVAAGLVAAVPQTAHAATTTLTVDSLAHTAGEFGTPGQNTLYAVLNEANSLPASPGDDIRIDFADSLSGEITISSGAEVGLRMANGNIGVRPDVLGSGAFFEVDAERPVTIDFGGDVGVLHTTDAGYSGLLISSDDVTVTGFTQFRAGESGIVVGPDVAGATISDGVISDPDTILTEVGVGVTTGVTDLTIDNVEFESVFRHGVFIDQSAVVDGITIVDSTFTGTQEFSDVTFWNLSNTSNVAVTGSSFNSPATTGNFRFNDNTTVSDMTVQGSTFAGGNDRASFWTGGNSITNNLQVIDNEFTGAWVFEDNGGGVHTGLEFRGNRIEEARIWALDFNQARYEDVVVDNNDFLNARGSGDSTIWVGVTAGERFSGGNNVISNNRFIQEEAFLAEFPAFTNRWAIFNDARGDNADSPTGWSIIQNHVDGYDGSVAAPIENLDIGYNTVWGNTFGPRTQGSLEPAQSEVGRGVLLWNETALANKKIQTWRVTSQNFTSDTEVEVTAESVAPLAGNNAETQPVEVHAYWTADDHAEVYLGQFSGGPHAGSATETFTAPGSVEFTGSTAEAPNGTVRVQIIDAAGNSSQYSGRPDGDLEPDLSFRFECETGQVFIGQNNPTQLFTAVQGEGGVTFEAEGPSSGVLYNALAFRESDQYLYAIRGDGNLLKIGRGGVVEDLGDVGLPAGNFNQGTFGAGDDADVYYVRSVEALGTVFVIDVEAGTSTTLDLSQNVPNVSDIVYVDGFLFGLINDNAWRIDAASGAVSPLAMGLGFGAATFGAQWTYGNGDIGVSNNDTGNISRIAIDDPAAAARAFTRVFTVAGPTSSNNDGAACIGGEVDYELVKDGPASYVDGDQVTYTLTVTNNGPDDSSGFVVTDQLPAGLTGAATTTPECDIDAGVVTCTFGPVSNGGSETITITGVADGGGDPIVNTARVSGNELDPDAANDEATTTATANVADPIVAPATCQDPFVETFGAGTGWGPQLAPGLTTYTYQGDFGDRRVSDGEYAIVSDADITEDGFWHSGGDATGDPNGRFMLVNADDQAAGTAFYERSVTGLVVGQRYVLSAAVANANRANSPILPNVRLAMIDPSDDSVVAETTTGEIPNQQSLVWTAYGLEFVATAEDLTLVVSNVGQGGVGNDLALDDISFAQACPELTLVKTASLNDANGNGAADVGETIDFSFEVSNTGNVTIDDIEVIDDTVTGLTPTGFTLAAGAAQTVTADPYVVTEADAAAGEVVNTASARGTSGGEAVESEPDTVTVGVANPALSLVKDASLNDTNGNGRADVGETIDYTFLVTNTGNVTVEGINVVDSKVTGLTPSDFTLEVGEDQLVTADPYVVTAADVAAGRIVNTATAEGRGVSGGRVAASAPSTVTTPTAAPPRPRARPRITTQVVKKKVRLQVRADGSVKPVALRDRITIRGFRPGGSSVGRASLYGPVAKRNPNMCRPANLVKTVRFQPRNGTFRSKPIRVNKPGVYTWVVRTSRDANNVAASHRCGLPRETVIVQRPAVSPIRVDTGPTMGWTAAGRQGLLQIPDLEVRAKLVTVGSRNGVMEIPTDIATGGWLTSSAVSGDVIGRTVIAGHVSDNRDNPGAFFRVQQARKGQVISLKTPHGTRQRYRVVKTFSQPRSQQLPKKLFKTTGPHRLTLITCTGKVTFAGGRFSYTRNKVVIAKPIR